MRHLTRTLLIAFMMITALSRASIAQSNWQSITDQEAGFTISFPGKPTYEQSVDPTLAHQTEKYKFFYNGRLLQVVFAPLNRPVRTSTELSDAFSEITRVHGEDGILLRQVKLPDGGRQYDNFTRDKAGTAYHRTRVYIRNGRYYAISYSMYSTDGLDERAAAPFFASFKFLDGSSGGLPASRSSARRKAKSGNVQRSRWYKFRSPNSDFVVDFPAKPDFKEFPNSDTGTSDYKYYFHFGENTFIVSYREEPQAALQPKEVMRRVLEKELKNDERWRVLQQIPLRNGGHYIESQGVVDGIPVYMRTKVYLRGTRLYHITALTQNLTELNKDDVVRFLSSFRLF